MVARREEMDPQHLIGVPGRREGVDLPANGPPRVAPQLGLAPPPGASSCTGDPRSHLRPNPRTTSAPEVGALSRPGRIAWWLWVLLLGSLVFVAVARVYVRHENAKLSAPMETVPFLQTTGPTDPVRAGALALAWSEVPGATSYRLSVSSITGQIVVDALPVDGTEWIPPDDALPALVRGEYRWAVEALDDQGTVLAKSASRTFRVM